MVNRARIILRLQQLGGPTEDLRGEKLGDQVVLCYILVMSRREIISFLILISLPIFLGIFIYALFTSHDHSIQFSQLTNKTVTSNKETQSPKKVDDAALEEIDNRVKEYTRQLMGDYPADRMLKILNEDRFKLTTAESAYARPNNKKQKRRLAKIRTLRSAVELLTREVFAKILERKMLDNGLNARISTKGSNKQTLVCEYILMTKVRAANLLNDGNLLLSARDVGFKKLIFTDGLQSSWTYDITMKKVTVRKLK
jgi:hypothetical protein